MGRALLVSQDHRLRGTRLPPGERAQILCKAVGLAERHLAAGTLLSGAPLGRCRSLLPLGGRLWAGLSARLYFAARHKVMLQLMRLAAQCRGSGACGRLPACGHHLVTIFSWTTSPVPSRGGRLCSRMPGGGGARPQCPARGSTTRPRGGRVVHLPGAGPPGIPGRPESGPSAGTPVHGTGQNAGYLPLLRPGAQRPQARREPNRTNREDPGGVGPQPTGGGATDPFSPPPAGGGRRPGAGPRARLRHHRCHGGTVRTTRPPLPPPPPSPPAERPPSSLPNVFGSISAALSSRTVPRRRPPRGLGDGLSRRPIGRWRTCSAHALPLRLPPHALVDAVRGSSCDPMADAPSTPPPSQSTLPQQWLQHGKASREET